MKAFEKALEAAAAFLLTGVVGIVLVEVVARYLLKISLSWPEELARYTLVWLTFVGAAVGAAGSHDCAPKRSPGILPKQVQRWLKVATRIFLAWRPSASRSG